MGFPKNPKPRGTLLGVPIIRAIVFWDLHGLPPIGDIALWLPPRSPGV